MNEKVQSRLINITIKEIALNVQNEEIYLLRNKRRKKK
jgi:hypothetical protein